MRIRSERLGLAVTPVLIGGCGQVRDDQGIRTLDLYGSSSSGAILPVKPLNADDGLPSVSSSSVAWLADGRIAFLSADGMHIANPDGTRNHTVSPAVIRIVPAQRNDFETRVSDLF